MKEQKENFYQKVFALVIPMALQNLINVGVSATDVLMLGKVGEKALSGCSLGGQMFWILSLFLFGAASGGSVLVAQYWGKKETEAIEKVMAISILFTEIVAILFMLASLIFPEQIMSVYTKDPEVARQGVRYMRVLAFTYPIAAYTMTYLNLLKSIEKVVISTVVYASSLLLNIVVNAILIFGLFGAPQLGVVGAAIGTLSARCMELLIVLFYSKCKCKEVRVHLSMILKPDKILTKDFFYYAYPVILNEVLWGVGYSANTAIMGRLGSSATAANSVAQVIRQLSMVVGFGVSNATAIMIGKAIGEKRKDVAESYAKKLVRLSFVCGIAGSILVLVIRPLIVTILGFTGQTATYLMNFLLVMSYYVIGQALNSTFVVGIFRSGGDTRFGMILDMTTMWCCSILLGALAAFVFKLPVTVVYIILLSDEIIKLPFCFMRYRQKKWLKDVTR
ncbi:MAG: MATE family efflux transporter [Lachnospiraceae bacterium]|nr:MATE family efflux transporter [Lachnospiraceae bacterium]